jgi:conjugal transfer/entry exclusion protein
MENTVNVQEVVKTAVELEKVKQQVAEMKTQALLYQNLLEDYHVYNLLNCKPYMPRSNSYVP